MLYHTGILQKVILKLGWLLQTLVGTTACESMNAAGNTFLGMVIKKMSIVFMIFFCSFKKK